MARKHCRSRVRTRGKVVLTSYTRMVAYFAYAQFSAKWADWTYRTISLREVLNLVAAGEAEPIKRKRDGLVQVVGYRALKPTGWEGSSPASLTYSTTVAVGNAAKGNPKLTRHERNEIVRHRVWVLIGDQKAASAARKLSIADMQTAQATLNMSTLPQMRGVG